MSETIEISCIFIYNFIVNTPLKIKQATYNLQLSFILMVFNILFVEVNLYSNNYHHPYNIKL